jgi:hypothetical protein
MRLACLMVLTWLGVSQLPAQEVLRWSFERSDAASPAVQPTASTVPPTYSERVPAAYIYDPLTQTSRPNTASRSFAGSSRKSDGLQFDVDFDKLGLTGQSVTIEAFVRHEPQGGGGDAWLVGKSRTSPNGSELALQWFELRNANQTWHGLEFVAPDQNPVRFPVGHYSSSTRLAGDVDRWRHVAVVYDAAAKTVTGWVDYHLSRSEKLEVPLVWDDGRILIGGRPDHWGLTGQIDEVRVVRGALGPAQFQRARADSIAKVSFESKQTIVPRDGGCLDLKEHFGAVGDGRTDDTAAFNSAFEHLANRVPLAYNTLVIPPGEYLVSGMLHCSRFIDVKGAGPEKTVIRLKDGTFTDLSKPVPVLRMSSTATDPGSHDWVNGSSISLYLDGVTIDTGKNNPGAKALEFHSNNLGRLENVVLRSGDGQGVMGLDLTHHDVGPALVKHVTIDGFDVGSQIHYQEYSMTLEQITLRNQKVVGIRNRGNILAIRRLHSDNAVTAVVGEGPNSMITLLDSELIGGNSGQPAIRSEGALYALRVKTSGYQCAIQKRTLTRFEPAEWKESQVAGPDIDEYIGDQVLSGFGSPQGALKLAIEETPEPPVPPVSEWVNVTRFRDRVVNDDWGPALQAAIDSGARVIYLPRGEVGRFSTPVRLHGNVERLMGLGGELHWHDSVWKGDRPRNQTQVDLAPPPLLIFDEPNPSRVVVLDRLGVVHLQHASPATLVLRSSSPDRYTTGAAGGKLFAEDVGGADWHFDHPQRVWVRQWNPESHEAGPCIHSRGASIWCLGFKTEYESQKLLAEAEASTEILGSFIYPIGKIPEDRPIFENRNSRMSLVYGASIYQANHKVHIRDVQGTNVKEYGSETLKWAGSRARVDLFTTDGISRLPKADSPQRH